MRYLASIYNDVECPHIPATQVRQQLWKRILRFLPASPLPAFLPSPLPPEAVVRVLLAALNEPALPSADAPYAVVALINAFDAYLPSEPADVPIHFQSSQLVFATEAGAPHSRAHEECARLFCNRR